MTEASVSTPDQVKKTTAAWELSDNLGTEEVSQGVADTGGERINVPDSRLMCGRFLNKLPGAEIARIFGTRNPLPNYPARFNIAPTDQGSPCASTPRRRSALSKRCGGASSGPPLSFPLEDLGHATLDRSG